MNNDKIVIFGAGYRGLKLLKQLNIAQVLFFVDNDPLKQGEKIEGLDIHDPVKLLEIPEDCKIYIAAMESETIVSQLKKMQIVNYLVWSMNEEINYVEEKRYDQVIEDMERMLHSYHDSGSEIKSILLAGYNVDQFNFGCRATSAALREILLQDIKIQDYIYKKELHELFRGMQLMNHLLKYVARIKVQYKDVWNSLYERMSKVDALVINGEGSFIFGDFARDDEYIFVVLIFICMECGKTFYIVNAMISGKNENEINEKQLSLFLKIFEKARYIYVRDPLSKEIIERKNTGVKVDYIPDALFTRTRYFDESGKYVDHLIKNIAHVLPFNEYDEREYELQGDYVVFSGNSLIGKYQDRFYGEIKEFVVQLKENLINRQIQLVLMECCKGDHLLNRIGRETNTLVIPVETNLTIAYQVLKKAKCFVSGRYHPSIMAYLGGTPCVFMGCNSHKTFSLQLVMGNIHPICYNAVPDKAEGIEIIKQLNDILELTDYEEYRNRIKVQCEYLGSIANELGRKLKNENRKVDY